MGIRIDLLPRYVGMRRWFKRILLICMSLVASFAAVLYLLYYRDQLELQTAKDNVELVRGIAADAEKAQQEADQKKAEAQPLQATVNFFVDASRTGGERAALLDLVRRYIYNRAVISSLDLSDGQTAKFSGMVRNPDEYANFVENLRRGTAPVGILFSAMPGGQGILGYPNKSGSSGGGPGGAPGGAPPGGAPGQPGQPGGGAGFTDIKFEVFPNAISASGPLREPVVIPVAPGEAAAGGGAPGAGAPPGGPPTGAPPPGAAPPAPGGKT